MKITGWSAAVVLLAGVPALAGTVLSSGTVSLYGQTLQVTQWRVAGDAGTPGFDPEALTFYNGVLYANADNGTSAGNGRLVSYTPGASGSLASPSFVTMGTNGGTRWGAEGLTVNTSGAGYGSFGPGGFKLVSVDTAGSVPNLAVINVDAPGSPKPLSAVTPTLNIDDLTWVGSRNQFALLVDADGSVQWFDANMNDTGVNIAGIAEAKGITTISASWALSAFGLVSSTPEVLLLAAKETNRLAAFDTNGLLLGSVQDLLPVGGPLFREIEGIAVDEANNLIYLADEAALSIHVIKVPGPTALAVLGMGGVIASRRRRA